MKIATYLNFAILENESSTDNKMKHGRSGKVFVTFCRKSKFMDPEKDLKILYLKGISILRKGQLNSG